MSELHIEATKKVRLKAVEVMARHGVVISGDDDARLSLNSFIWFTVRTWFAVGFAAGIGVSLIVYGCCAGLFQ